MRLDLYLAKKRNHLTRSKAQRAIKLGLIKVNNKVITKPAYDLKDTDKVSITDRFLAKKPADYFKLKEIQSKTNLIKPNSTVLVLANKGYVLATEEIAKKVIKDISLDSWPSDIGNVDLILSDKEIEALHSVLPSLKRDGKILLMVKVTDKDLEKYELVIEKVVKLDSDTYTILKRK